MTSKKTYKSKLLLFGEHILIKGAQALAIPFFTYHGGWNYTSSAQRESIQFRLYELVEWLYHKQKQGQLPSTLNVEHFKKELNNGLYFQSNIPVGYGVGSSGALCAGIYDQFCIENNADVLTIRKHLAAMESFFHGSSSGIDPLVSYLEKAIVIEKDSTIQQVDLSTLFMNQKDATIFILDTKIPRETAPLVNLFLEKCKDEYFYKRILTELIPYNDDAIHAILKGDWLLLFELVHEISYFQFKYFKPMIPNAFEGIWVDGLSSDLYKLKLCGAGGGGFILGFTKKFEQTRQHLSNWELREVRSRF